MAKSPRLLLRGKSLMGDHPVATLPLRKTISLDFKTGGPGDVHRCTGFKLSGPISLAHPRLASPAHGCMVARVMRYHGHKILGRSRVPGGLFTVGTIWTADPSDRRIIGTARANRSAAESARHPATRAGLNPHHISYRFVRDQRSRAMSMNVQIVEVDSKLPCPSEAVYATMLGAHGLHQPCVQAALPG